MEKHQVDESGQTKTGNQSNENEGSNANKNPTAGNQSNPNDGSDPNNNSQNPSGSQRDDKGTETPGIGDDQPKESDEITMSVGDDEDSDSNDNQNSEEPVEEGPLNGKPEERKIGDSDAQAVVNGTENQVVNK